MVRKAVAEDTLILSLMLKEMAVELFPANAVADNDIYWDEIFKYMRDDTIHIFIDDELRGFFMVKEESEPIYSDMTRYIWTKVFIYPKHRKGRILKCFYDKVEDAFPTGDIIGLTEINSEHIPVLEKRHQRIANVYKFIRS